MSRTPSEHCTAKGGVGEGERERKRRERLHSTDAPSWLTSQLVLQLDVRGASSLLFLRVASEEGGPAADREGTAPKDEDKVTSASNTICLGRLLALTFLLGAPEPSRRLQLVGSASSPCSCAFVSAPDLAMGESAAAAAMIAPPCPSIRSGGVSGPLFRRRRPLGEPPWLPLRDARPFPVLRVSRRSIPGWRRQDAGPAARQRC